MKSELLHLWTTETQSSTFRPRKFLNILYYLKGVDLVTNLAGSLSTLVLCPAIHFTSTKRLCMRTSLESCLLWIGARMAVHHSMFTGVCDIMLSCLSKVWIMYDNLTLGTPHVSQKEEKYVLCDHLYDYAVPGFKHFSQLYLQFVLKSFPISQLHTCNLTCSYSISIFDVKQI